MLELLAVDEIDRLRDSLKPEERSVLAYSGETMARTLATLTKTREALHTLLHSVNVYRVAHSAYEAAPGTIDINDPYVAMLIKADEVEANFFPHVDG